MSLLARLTVYRARRHAARAEVFGAATAAALLNGDTERAAEFLEHKRHAQAMRDQLRARVNPWAAAQTCCNHNCDEGRACPARS